MNLNVFNKITGINESNVLAKHISCECKCRFDGKRCNSYHINGKITRNVKMSVKNAIYVKKIMFVILLHVIVKIENIEQVLWMIQLLFVLKL